MFLPSNFDYQTDRVTEPILNYSLVIILMSYGCLIYLAPISLFWKVNVSDYTERWLSFNPETSLFLSYTITPSHNLSARQHRSFQVTYSVDLNSSFYWSHHYTLFLPPSYNCWITLFIFHSFFVFISQISMVIIINCSCSLSSSLPMETRIWCCTNHSVSFSLDRIESWLSTIEDKEGKHSSSISSYIFMFLFSLISLFLPLSQPQDYSQKNHLPVSPSSSIGRVTDWRSAGSWIETDLGHSFYSPPSSIFF